MASDIVDDIDWNVVWKGRLLRSLSARGGVECSRMWEGRDSALCYDSGVCSDGRKKAIDLIRRMDVPSGSRVLDVGAGPGTHTVPMAGIVGHVTAVEPSEGMACCLESHLWSEGIRNVTVVRKKWEDVDIGQDLDPPYDVVLASLSLGMPDIGSAIVKMNDAASGSIYLIWAAGPTLWERNYVEAWPELHGKEYYPGPKADCLYSLLCQMGIYPDVSVFEDEYVEKYSCMDEAVERNKIYYDAVSRRQLAALRRFLEKKLVQEKGQLVWRGTSPMAMIRWRKP